MNFQKNKLGMLAFFMKSYIYLWKPSNRNCYLNQAGSKKRKPKKEIILIVTQSNNLGVKSNWKFECFQKSTFCFHPIFCFMGW